MIFEILPVLGVGTYGIIATIRNFRAVVGAENPIPEQTYSPSYQVELIEELLRSSDEWTERYEAATRSSHSSGTKVLEHPHGVKVETYSTYFGASHSTFHEMYWILNESNDYELVETTLVERKHLAQTLKAYRTRAKDRKQSALGRALANRVLSDVRPVLGDTGVPRIPPSGDDTVERNDPVPAADGTLYYDEAKQQIVATVRGERVSLAMDDKLLRRYSIPTPPKTQKVYY